MSRHRRRRRAGRGRERGSVSESPLLQLTRHQQELRRPSTCCTTSTSPSTRARSPRWSATTAPARRTLVKCIAGIYPIDSGEILFEGKPVTMHEPARRDRARHRGRLPGPRAVRQPRHRPEHVPRPRDSAGASCSTRATMERRARETLASLSVRTVKSVRQLVASLSGGQRQTVAIAKAVLWNSKVVILDEPTAALGVAQTEQVLDAGPPARRPRPRRRAHLAQHERRPRGRRPDRGALPRPDGRGGHGQGRHAQRRSSS